MHKTSLGDLMRMTNELLRYLQYQENQKLDIKLNEIKRDAKEK